MLESHAIEVDTVESAKRPSSTSARRHPDVIFMDHLMPGMDGFQAVQAIKIDPRTATIPIMMYTSQEGELYLGQARALGAIGVMPKQIKPADVSKVLYQLHLVPDRRTAEASARRADGVERRATAGIGRGFFATAETAVVQQVQGGLGGSATGTHDRLNLTAEAAIAGESSPAVVNETLVRDQIAELRRFVVANLEQHTERVLAELRDRAAEIQATAKCRRDGATGAAAERPTPSPALAWAAALVGLTFGEVFLVLWRQEAGERAGLESQLAAVPPRVIEPGAGGGAGSFATAAAAVPAEVAPAEAPNDSLVVEPVPYGELPLGGPVSNACARIVTPLIARGFRGSVHVSAYTGRFCVEGNASEGLLAGTRGHALRHLRRRGLRKRDRQRAATRVAGVRHMISDLRKRAGGNFDIAVGRGYIRCGVPSRIRARRPRSAPASGIAPRLPIIASKCGCNRGRKASSTAPIAPVQRLCLHCPDARLVP